MPADETHVMWGIGQIAARDQVSKAAVSKHVKKMCENMPDAPVERGGQGQVLRVSLAHYDHYRQRHLNPAKTKEPIKALKPMQPGDGGAGSQSDTFEEARRQSEWLRVGLARIRHQEECGQLIRKDRIDEAHRQIGRDLQMLIQRLPNRADDLAAAVAREGAHGARMLLRKIAFELGNGLADRLEAMAAQAPAGDETIEAEGE